MSSVSNIDKIRAATVGSKKVFRTEIVKIDNVDIEVRELTKIRRSEIIKDSDGDNQKLEQLLLIECCYEPGTDNKPFSLTDVEALWSFPSGGFLDDLLNAVTRVHGITRVEDAKKS